MGFVWPIPSVLPAAKTVSHQYHMARLGFLLMLSKLKSQILGSLFPESFSKIHFGMGMFMTRCAEKPLSQPFSVQTLLSALTTDQAMLPKSKAAVAFGSLVTLPSGVGRTSVKWVIQSLRPSLMNERIQEWAASCLFLLPRVLNGDGPLLHHPSCHYRIYGLHALLVKLFCGILLPQACECLELCVYISRATV